jgi:hypothetical protein
VSTYNSASLVLGAVLFKQLKSSFFPDDTQHWLHIDVCIFSLATHGGPPWQPLCYAKIGGLTVVSFITLLMVPVLYSITVLDLKWLTWEEKAEQIPEETDVPLSSKATNQHLVSGT